MSKRDLLLEIGLEEMPANVVTNSMNQLGNKVAAWLDENRINYSNIDLYSTPRRLTVVISNVAESQEDIEEEARGPAKKIVKDDEGNWSKAALGFAKGQGVSVEDFFFKEVKGTEYVFVNKFIKGKETKELLPQLKDIIVGLHFPKNMRWSEYSLKYIRPIHWICFLFGTEIIPIEITDVKSGNKTYGHRFLGNEITLRSPSEYKELLLGEYVIADSQERKQSIRMQLTNLENESGWLIPIDEDLLEEVNNLVEYPTAVTGTFDEKYLNIPEEVLITSMKEHQRYFPVKDQAGNLLPKFITFRNGDHKHLVNVAKGNEKVLRARLSDAEFFYEEDQKMNIDDALRKLDKIVFHEELGTIGDKVRRIRELSGQLSTLADFSNEKLQDVDRAAEICKFDLVTHMVYEFTELQGTMGEKYAKLFGEKSEVAKAINEHYMPRSASDMTPQSDIGAILSIADKLDTIVGFFSINIIPTGSQDPYALRRQASGIVQTILAKSWNLRIETLLEITLESYKNLQLVKRDSQEVYSELIQFFLLRFKSILQDRQIRYDVIDAVLSSGIGDVSKLVQKADFLMEQLDKSEFKGIVEALSRVTNIASKAESKHYDPAVFTTAEEKALHDVYVKIKDQYFTAVEKGQMQQAFDLLASSQKEIDAYFDNIMVMTDDQTERNNRLGQLATFSELIHSFAKFNAILLK